MEWGPEDGVIWGVVVWARVCANVSDWPAGFDGCFPVFDLCMDSFWQWFGGVAVGCCGVVWQRLGIGGILGLCSVFFSAFGQFLRFFAFPVCKRLETALWLFLQV